MPPGVQRYKRTKMVLPLRFWPDDENGQNGPLLAHTVDISPIGGRLGGLRNPLQTGQTIMLQRGQNRVQFRVIWTNQLGPSEIQAGIESVVFKEKIWGVDLPEEPTSPASSHTRHDFATQAARAVNRRRHWAAVAASLLVTVSVGGFVGHWILRNYEPVATITLPATAPAVVVPVIASSPRPYGNVRVIFSSKDSDSNRLQVAEAPQGHVIYPDSPDANLTGTVGMKAVIATDGRVKEIHVLSGNRILADAAVQAVRFWRYTRHELNGDAVEAETSVTISFHGQDAVSIRFPSASSDGLALKTKVAS
jgi:Gram-negative bacterial TonB protein C-terminal